jgi:hypothetical protein
MQQEEISSTTKTRDGTTRRTLEAQKASTEASTNSFKTPDDD